MLYVALLFHRRERSVETEVPPSELLFIPAGTTTTTTQHFAELTYDDFEHLTGLSRSLIRQGLLRLTEMGLVQAQGSRQQREYILAWPGGRWFKLPCRAILRRDGIAPFKTFTLRTKHELNAMKLYLYLADVRNRSTFHSEVSYEVIRERLGTPERDIRRAINVLTAAGLLARVQRETERAASYWGPNKYFLTGYQDLIAATTAV